jgi:hypothetical protein
VEPVNRFLGAVSIYDSEIALVADGEKTRGKPAIESKWSQDEPGTLNIAIKSKDKTENDLVLYTYNLAADDLPKVIHVGDANLLNKRVEFRIENPTKPYVLVLRKVADATVLDEFTRAQIDDDLLMD